MTILADPVGVRSAERGVRSAKPQDYYALYRQMIESGQGCTEVVALADNAAGVPAGTRHLCDAQGTVVCQLGEAAPAGGVGQNLPPVHQRAPAAGARGASPPPPPAR